MTTVSPAQAQTATISTRILLADDEEPMRRFLTKFLGGKGHTISAAKSGEDALELWKNMEPKPQLLISDLSMPAMSGIDLAVLLKKFQPGIKVLFITGFGPEMMGQATSTVTNSHHLFKPFEPDELASLVEAALAEP